MRNSLRGVALVFTVGLVAALLVVPAGASRWDSQVTGGVTVNAGGTMFDLDVSSRTASDGTTKGQVQYTRSDLSMHASIECLYISNGNVAMGGPAMVQEGTASGEWMYVEIRADGQAVRVRLGSAGLANCGYSGSYPGAVVDGSFNMRL